MIKEVKDIILSEIRKVSEWGDESEELKIIQSHTTATEADEVRARVAERLTHIENVFSNICVTPASGSMLR